MDESSKQIGMNIQIERLLTYTHTHIHAHTYSITDWDKLYNGRCNTLIKPFKSNTNKITKTLTEEKIG